MPRRLSRALNEQKGSVASFHLQAKAGWMDLVEISRKSRPKQTAASAALAAVHSINTPSSFHATREADAKCQGGIGDASRRAARRRGRLAAYTGGRHPYKQRKVIVSESIVDSSGALLTGSSQRRLDGGSTEAKRSPLLRAATVLIAQKNLIQDPLYFFFFLPSFLLLWIS